MRHAVYWAPALGSPWWEFGARWLGRDEQRDAPLPATPPPGWTPEAFAALTAAPRRYGFHATLKAPFRLQVPVDEAGLKERLDALAATLRAVPLGQLVPVHMEGFVALVPAQRSPALEALATQCVTQLDDLRAPPTAEELARRKPQALDDRGRELLMQWGYPHTQERFRFHLTLTGPVDRADAGRLVAHLAPLAQRLHAQSPPTLDRLCLFREAAPGAPLVRIHEAVLR